MIFSTIRTVGNSWVDSRDAIASKNTQGADQELCKMFLTFHSTNSLIVYQFRHEINQELKKCIRSRILSAKVVYLD